MSGLLPAVMVLAGHAGLSMPTPGRPFRLVAMDVYTGEEDGWEDVPEPKLPYVRDSRQRCGMPRA